MSSMYIVSIYIELMSSMYIVPNNIEYLYVHHVYCPK